MKKSVVKEIKREVRALKDTKTLSLLALDHLARLLKLANLSCSSKKLDIKML